MKNQNGYVDSFAKLIKCPTVSDSGKEFFDKFHKVLDEEFPHLTATCEKFETGRSVLLYKWKGKSQDKPIVLMAHQDVVPATGDDWTVDPYAGVVKDGKLYGRGTIDCKNVVFGTMQAVDELIEEGFVPEHDVYLSFSDSEEIGGPGCEINRDWLVSHGVKPGIVLDEGGAVVTEMIPGMKHPLATLGVMEKGHGNVRVIARGKGGHSSQPPKNTPIVRLARFVNYCDKHTVFKPKMSPVAKEMVRSIGKVTPGFMGWVCKNVGIFGSLLVHTMPKKSPEFWGAIFQTTIAFTMMEGSSATNIIPNCAWVNANLRFSPNDKSADCIKKLERIAKRFGCEIEVQGSHEATPEVNFSGEEYNCLVASVKECFPDAVIAPYMLFGGTDCRTMQEICDTAIRFMPCVMTAEQDGRMHAADENIDIDAIGKMVNCYKTFIKSYK